MSPSWHPRRGAVSVWRCPFRVNSHQGLISETCDGIRSPAIDRVGSRGASPGGHMNVNSCGSARRTGRAAAIIVALMSVLSMSAPAFAAGSAAGPSGRPASAQAATSSGSTPAVDVPVPLPAAAAAVGRDHALWVRPVASGGYSSLGGLLVSGPAMVTNAGATLYVVEGSNQTLYVRSNQLGWRRLATGGFRCRQPGAVVQATTLTVACLATDGSIRVGTARLQPATLPLITAWSNLGGSFGSGPAVAVVAGKVTVAATQRAASGVAPVVTRAVTSGGWAATALRCVGAPALTADAVTGNNAVLGCAGAYGAFVYLRGYTVGSHATPAASAGPFVPGVGLTHDQSGNVIAVATAPSQAVYSRSLSTATSWKTLGGHAIDGAAAGQLDEGDQACQQEISGTRTGSSVTNLGDYTTAVNGSGTTQLTNVAWPLWDLPAWSPDGQALGYWAPGPAGVDQFHFDWHYACMARASDLSQAHAVFLSADAERSLHWTPDSQQLVTLGIAAEDPYGTQQNYFASWDRTVSSPWPTCGCVAEDVRADGTWLLTQSVTYYNGVSQPAYTATAGQQPVPVLTVSGELGSPRWSPDGQSFAFWANGGLHIAASDGSRQRLVWDSQQAGYSNAWPEGINWSPDGTRIAAALSVNAPSHNEQEAAYLFAADGTSAQDLQQSQGEDLNWSHDGTMLAQTHWDGTTSTVSVLTLSTGAQRQLASIPSANGNCLRTATGTSPTFSPSNTQILFTIGQICYGTIP